MPKATDTKDQGKPPIVDDDKPNHDRGAGRKPTAPKEDPRPTLPRRRLFA